MTELTEEQKKFLDDCVEFMEAHPIKCPYCGYDGSDLKIGRKPIAIDNLGVPHIVCAKCNRRFNIHRFATVAKR